MNILDKISEVKSKLKSHAEELLKEGIIDQGEYEGFISSLERERIKIGVVGQVKNGKSTLLNALIFQKPFLPVASTPMTASLSFITYGEEEGVEVEFYTKDEWEKIEETAKDKSDGSFRSEVVESAKELIELSKNIKNLDSFFGKSKKISFGEIKDYVGEGGKYVPITKSITIRSNNQRLRDVDFIDTPGFNDPIISREMRARESLREADAVIVVLYAGRPFDESDKELIFNRLPGVGSGKIVFVVNKKDTILEDLGVDEKVEKYIKDNINRFCAEIERENRIMSKVIKNSKIISFSALSALIGVMSDDDIEKDDVLSWYYKKFKDEFPFLKTKDDFIEFSGLRKLESILEEIIKKEKYDILVKKPITYIIGKWKEKFANLRETKYNLETKKKSYAHSLKEIVEEKNKLKEKSVELGGFISDFEGHIQSELAEKKKKVIDQVANEFNSLRYSLKDIREKNFLETHTGYSEYVSSEVNSMLYDKIEDIKSKVSEYVDDAYGLLKDMISKIDRKITEITELLTFTRDDINNLKKAITSLLDYQIGDIKFEYISIQTSGFWGLGTFKAKSEAILQAKIQLNLIKQEIEEQIKDYLDKIIQLVSGKMSYIRENYEMKVIKPVINALSEVERNYENRQNEIKRIESELSELEEKIKYIGSRISDIESDLEQLLK